MPDREKLFLIQYLLSLRDRLQADVEYCRVMVFRTRCDPIDLLELIIAKSRYTLFDRMASDILALMKMNSA
jgi:hypothetical protein